MAKKQNPFYYQIDMANWKGTKWNKNEIQKRYKEIYGQSSHWRFKFVSDIINDTSAFNGKSDYEISRVFLLDDSVMRSEWASDGTIQKYALEKLNEVIQKKNKRLREEILSADSRAKIELSLKRLESVKAIICDNQNFISLTMDEYQKEIKNIPNRKYLSLYPGNIPDNLVKSSGFALSHILLYVCVMISPLHFSFSGLTALFNVLPFSIYFIFLAFYFLFLCLLVFGFPSIIFCCLVDFLIKNGKIIKRFNSNNHVNVFSSVIFPLLFTFFVTLEFYPWLYSDLWFQFVYYFMYIFTFLKVGVFFANCFQKKYVF